MKSHTLSERAESWLLPTWQVASALLRAWAVIGAIWLLFRSAWFRWRLRNARRVTRGRAVEWLRELTSLVVPPSGGAARFRLKAGLRARLLIVPGFAEPAAFGIWQPTIVLPPSCESLDREALRAVLAHELGHIARGDLWWLAIGREVPIKRHSRIRGRKARRMEGSVEPNAQRHVGVHRGSDVRTRIVRFAIANCGRTRNDRSAPTARSARHAERDGYVDTGKWSTPTALVADDVVSKEPGRSPLIGTPAWRHSYEPMVLTYSDGQGVYLFDLDADGTLDVVPVEGMKSSISATTRSRTPARAAATSR